LRASEATAERARDRERLAAAVRDAGALALKYFRGQLKSWNKGKGDHAPVTEADIAANELLRERLVGAGEGWLSEESENDPTRLDARRVWVVDPIDGTRAYIAGREDWSISAALVEAGRPVIAAVFAPATDELFLATAGEGATRNGLPIQASGGASLAGVRIAGPPRAMERIAAQCPEMTVVPRIHSLALRLVRVAQSEIDAAVAGGSAHDWDLAAADLLVHEAGGMVTALDGTALVYNRAAPVHGILVAAGRERHNALIDLVRAQMAAPA
jgi:myo-inositol-1(or 4)-monophosphatase